jgi:hypothetical protein
MSDTPLYDAMIRDLATSPLAARTVLRRGDELDWMGVHLVVTRVARDGSWADVQCRSGEHTWTKRQPLPLPAAEEDSAPAKASDATPEGAPSAGQEPGGG